MSGRCKIVDDVRDDENDRRKYSDFGPDKKQGRNERIEKRQSCHVGSADRIEAAIIPEKAVLD
jgi:hypothetical protein